jgi:hypothetical protein
MWLQAFLALIAAYALKKTIEFCQAVQNVGWVSICWW